MIKNILASSVFATMMIASNNLSHETSPYLLQHKDNPVDWYAWGQKPFDKAKKENKLIFLSIGYSTCHWCHVMAHESFEDKFVAKLLNKDYISIKVDREQFPHIDNFYQRVYQVFNQRGGGWPLTIIMSPEKEPFFAGTYIPKTKGYGSQGLVTILEDIPKIPREKLIKSGKEVLRILNKTQTKKTNKKFDDKLQQTAINQAKSSFDKTNKGFSYRPKFPQFDKIIMLYSLYDITKDSQTKTIADESLKAMANGGIYDQIDGAFYRYAVDEKWQIPHFEKMLYTNAEALTAYTKALSYGPNKLFEKTIVETIDEIDRRFKTKHLYKSASNADSKNSMGENHEGFFFVYDYDQTVKTLKKSKIDQNIIKNSLKYLGITEDGNFDGDLSNPHITSTNRPIGVENIKKLLSKMRDKRVYPFIDNKINTAWNGIYIKGKIQAKTIDKNYLKEALVSLDELLKLFYIDGELYHQTIDHKKPTQKGLLEDYAFVSSALFEAYQATMDKKYFDLFSKITKKSIQLFYKNDKWYMANDGFDVKASIDGGGYASSLGVNLQNLVLLGAMSSDRKLLDIANKTIDSFKDRLITYPSYFPEALIVATWKRIEPVIVKSTKQNLNKIDIKSVKYPFVYKHLDKSSDYLGCNTRSCFSYSKDFKIVKKKIESMIR
ncbi:MAG: hypothetical protein B1H07_02600 [Campylobacteraceae bacterium 4484_166]|nr:MAG: hypothetical protein B1H07_02600 [Campylobacteraceae bacterium 4484_166]